MVGGAALYGLPLHVDKKLFLSCPKAEILCQPILRGEPVPLVPPLVEVFNDGSSALSTAVLQVETATQNSFVAQPSKASVVPVVGSTSTDKLTWIQRVVLHICGGTLLGVISGYCARSIGTSVVPLALFSVSSTTLLCYLRWITIHWRRIWNDVIVKENHYRSRLLTFCETSVFVAGFGGASYVAFQWK